MLPGSSGVGLTMWVKSALAEAVDEKPRRARLKARADPVHNDLDNILSGVVDQRVGLS